MNYKRLYNYSKRRQKMALYRKNLIITLVESGYYTELYHRYQNDDENLRKLTNEDLNLLETFDYQTPEQLKILYNELMITS